MAEKEEGPRKGFEKLAMTLEKELNSTRGERVAREIGEEALEESTGILPQVPRFGGGPLNPFDAIPAATAQMVAMHRPMRSRGLPAEWTALLFYDYYCDLRQRLARPLRWLARKFIFSPPFLAAMRHFSRRMTERDDPDGFDISYHKGEGDYCDWYFSANRCGVASFLEKQSCADLARYCNMIDHIQGRVLGMGVRFESCLGAGRDGARAMVAGPEHGE